MSMPAPRLKCHETARGTLKKGMEAYLQGGKKKKKKIRDPVL